VSARGAAQRHHAASRSAARIRPLNAPLESDQPPGLRGTAFENPGHGALIALTHMFPEKVLLLEGSD